MPKAQPSGSLLEEVRANLPVKSRRTWISSVADDLRVELVGIRNDWRSGSLGEISRTAIAKAIATTLAARGSAVHHLTVAEWLKD